MIRSTVYKLSAGSYMRQLYPRYLKRWGWVYAIIVVALVLLSLVNINFLFVALMAVFIMLPMVLGFAYFFYAMSENCVASIRNGMVIVSEQCLMRQFVDEDGAVVGERKYDWTSFKSAEIVDSGILLFPDKTKLSFEYLPKIGFDEKNYEDVVALISNKLGVGK